MAADRTDIAFLLDHAFAGGEFHSLMGNLEAVDTAMWRTPLPESLRTIAEIALHVGSSKVMYADYAFGPGTLTWESHEVQPWSPETAPMADVIAWLSRVHEELMSHVRPLSGDDLRELRSANWGEQKETRWLLSTILQHDVYHAGEINRMRSILSGEDRWQWQIDVGIERSPQ